MNYQVWLHARHPKTLETVATVRVYAHEDRLRAEAVLENAQADHQPLVLALLQVHPGALVNAEMVQQIHDETLVHRQVLGAGWSAVIDALRSIAAFGDKYASEKLTLTGSYGHFDEPGAVQTAREALAQIGITE